MFCAKGARNGDQLRKFCAQNARNRGDLPNFAAWHGRCIKACAATGAECISQTLTKREAAAEVISNDMKTFNQLLLMAGMATVLTLSTGKVAAQNRGNFDPEQMRQRMMERYKERLEVTNDDEWKIISDRIEKVMTAQRDARIGGFGGFGGAGGRRGGGGGDNAQADNGGRRNRGGMFAGEPNPDAEALQKAIDSKASADELKTKMAKLRDSLKDKEAKLTKAQDELRKVLSVRQEAIAMSMGLLK